MNDLDKKLDAIASLELKLSFAKRSEFLRMQKIATETGYLDWANKKTKEMMLLFDTQQGKKLFEQVCYAHGGVKTK